MDSFKLKVTNYLTGEISEFEVDGVTVAAEKYHELNASKKALEGAIKQLQGYIEDSMGKDDKMDLGNGHRAERIVRTTRTWRRESLRQVGVDNDALDLISKVDMKAAKDLVSEMMVRGEIPPNAGKILDESAEVKYSSFVQVK